MLENRRLRPNIEPGRRKCLTMGNTVFSFQWKMVLASEMDVSNHSTGTIISAGKWDRPAGHFFTASVAALSWGDIMGCSTIGEKLKLNQSLDKIKSELGQNRSFHFNSTLQNFHRNVGPFHYLQTRLMRLIWDQTDTCSKSHETCHGPDVGMGTVDLGDSGGEGSEQVERKEFTVTRLT